MKKRAAILAPLVLIAGCATPSQRIAAKLGEYGVPAPQARCMGDRLQDRLSTAQLHRLGELASLNRDRLGRMSINDIARQLNGPQDSALAVEVVRAGLGCAI